jgi:ABC-type Zn uptake system ZnuABC Zn-binding protein ZnuA
MTRRLPIVSLGLIAAASLVLSACGSGDSGSTDSGASDDRLVVAATVAPITNIVSIVGGDLVEVEGIVPEGSDSHTFEPAPQVAELVSRADVIFVNGLQLEDPTIALAEANLKPGAEIVEIGTRLLPESDYLYDFSFPEEEGKPNPHLWTDPTYVIEYADVVREVLSERDPDNADAFTANFEAFTAEVAKLDAAVRTDQECLAVEDRKLVTYHDAYAYFAKNYDWTVIGAIEPSSFDEPTPAEVAQLIDQIREENVQVIFGSEVFPSNVLQVIADEAGVRYEDSLRDDDLPGAPGDEEHSLLHLLRYNFRTMISGLGCTPTELDALVFTLPTDNASYPQ